MDGCINEDFLTLPLVLDSGELEQDVKYQSVNLINCNSWHLEVSKDQTIPLVIFENGDLPLQTDCPMLLPSAFPNANLSVENEVICYSDDKLDTNDDKLHENSNICNLKTGSSSTTDGNNRNSPVLIEDLIETVVIYKCKLCNFKTADRAALSSHLKFFHLQNMEKSENSILKDGNTNKDLPEKMAYMCGKCSEAFGSFSDWRSHLSSVHKIVMGVKSVLENATLNGGSPVDLEKKIRSEPSLGEKKKKYIFPKKEKNVSCPIRSCLVRLSTKELMEKHKECHAGPRHFACPHCSAPFRKWCDCANHIWSAHSQDIDLYSCPTCKYKTAWRVKLEIHAKIHSDQRQFMCSECGKAFKQAVQLKNHCVSHLKAVNSPNIPNWSKNRDCPQCKKTFYDGKSLKKHIQSVHSNLRPYVCQVCGHTSANKNRMGLHLRQHTGEKPFSCPLCNFTTGDQNCLRRHAWRHSRVRPYSCPHCTYSCIQSNSLKKHILSQHPGASGVHSCGQCSFSSLSQSSLDSHISKAHGDRNEKNKSTQIIYISNIENPEASISTGSLQDGNAPVEVVLDDESQNCYEVPIIDTGGITIPADQ